MGTSHTRSHQAHLKGPVLGAMQTIERNIVVLVERGPEAFADAIATAVPGRHELTRRILEAVSQAVKDHVLEAPL